MIEDPRLSADTMDRTGHQQFVSEKRQNHVLKPVPSQQYQQCYPHDTHQPIYQGHRHHHHSQPPHVPQYSLQVR